MRTMNTYKQLRDSSWGARVEGTVAVGEEEAKAS